MDFVRRAKLTIDSVVDIDLTKFTTFVPIHSSHHLCVVEGSRACIVSSVCISS